MSHVEYAQQNFGKLSIFFFFLMNTILFQKDSLPVQKLALKEQSKNHGIDKADNALARIKISGNPLNRSSLFL